MISIIVPVYNVENYLKPCLDSILNQTFTDFELILVDDGSLDKSGSICDEYALQDKRIKVFHKQNGGTSDSRNKGLKESTGDYVLFIDSDDMIHSSMIEILYDAVKSGAYDFSMVFHRQVMSIEPKLIQNCSYRDVVPEILSQKDYLAGMYDMAYCGQYLGPCHKLFAKKLVEGLWFKPIAAEDAEWMTRVCMRMNQGVLQKRELYFYRVRPDSLSHSDKGMNQVIVDGLSTHLLCLKDISKNNTEYRAMCIHDLYRRLVYTRYRAKNTKYQNEVVKKCSDIYKVTIKEYLSCKLGWQTKLKYLLYYHFPSLYRYRIEKSESKAQMK